MTPDLLFRQMEERTEQVFSLVAEVRLSSDRGAAFARLAIQSPDKFEMTINEGEFRVVFDGESLWIFIASLNEVMTLDGSGGGGFFSEAFRQWVNPREIVARITRRTLFTFFDIAMSAPPPSGGWKLTFRPRSGGIWNRLFDVGTYDMEFASATCLPTRVAEFGPDGAERGVLEVLSYRLNEPLAKEWFRYEPASGVVRVPMGRVLLDKLSDGGEYLLGRLGNWFDGMKKSIDDWGF
ncbi:MAG TPA: hypothetical protein VIV61_09165 [Candidatus Ozemobacteraceae bacterium]